MAAWRLAFPRIGLVASLALMTGACSDETGDSPEEAADRPEQESSVASASNQHQPADAAADHSSAHPPGATADGHVKFWVTQTNPKDWTLHVSNGPYFSKVLPRMYRERCLKEEGDEAQCEALHTLLVVEATMALEEIERSGDQRGTEQGLAALELTSEPEILVAAMRILGQFPDTPGIADKVVPLLLESPYLQVQQMAARLLAANPDPTLAAVGSYWGGNHSTLYVENAYQEYPDFAPHYPGIGFPEYPDAEWFSPADADRSVGWSTGDDFATVSAWLSEALGAEGLSYQQWGERLAQESMAAFQAIDPDKQAELERLIEEWTKTQDMALLEKLQKLQEEMYAPVQAAGEVAEQGVAGLGPPFATETQEQVRFFVAEERAGRTARLVIAYPLKSLGRTVIQHAWSLADYPSAWPAAEEDPAQDQ